MAQYCRAVDDFWLAMRAIHLVAMGFFVGGQLMLAAVVGVFGLPAQAVEWEKLDLENTLVMELQYGRVIIEMRPDKAPKQCTMAQLDG